MRSVLISGKTLGIIIVLALLLEGCGHKSPLMLPAPKAQTTNPSTPDTQQPGLPSDQPNK
jgi:predicted small lipoprotein YifL